MIHTFFSMIAILGNLQVNHTISLDGIVNTCLTAMLAAVGYGLRRVYFAVTEFFTHIDAISLQLENTSTVVDTHSALLKRAALIAGLEMPKVSQKRRREDRETIPL